MAPKTDPRVQKAAEKLVLDPNLNAKKALELTGADPEIANDRKWQNKVYKKRRTIENNRQKAADTKKRKVSSAPDTSVNPSSNNTHNNNVTLTKEQLSQLFSEILENYENCSDEKKLLISSLCFSMKEIMNSDS